MVINAVGLIRVSTAGQAEQDKAGIPAQREAIRQLAQRYGLTIVRTFELVDVSGSRVLQNPDYQEFLRILQRADVTAAVAKELSRFMRPERMEDYKILDWFGDYGITLYLPDGPMDCSKRQDRFFASIRAGMAGLERLDIRDRMMGGKEALRRQGKHPSGETTLARGIGYDRKTGWYYKESELLPVRALFDAFLAGNHNYASLSELTGIPRTSVPGVLVNPVYAGTMAYRTKHDLTPSGAYPASDGGRVYRRKIQRLEEEQIYFALPLDPILTPAEHATIVSIVEGRRSVRTQVRKENRPRFTYRGFLKCGACQQPLYTHVGKTGKEFYHCKSRLPRYRKALEHLECTNRYMSRHLLEPKLDAVIFERLSNRRFLASQIERHLVERHARQSEGISPAQLAARIRTAEVKRSRVLDLYVAQDIDAAEKTRRLESIQTELQHLAKLSARSKVQSMDPGRIVETVQVFREWRMLNREQKRRLLGQMLPEIVVYRYEIRGATLRFGGDSDTHFQTVVPVTTLQAPNFTEIFIPFQEPQETCV